MAQGTWPLYPNLSPHTYEADVAAAEISGARPATVPSPAFDLLAVSGDPLIYVVTRSEVLVVATQFVMQGRIGHAVLASGRPVLVAGEVELIVLEGYKGVIRLNNRSGHYRPQRNCLALVAGIFRSQGFDVQEEVIEYIQ